MSHQPTLNLDQLLRVLPSPQLTQILVCRVDKTPFILAVMDSDHLQHLKTLLHASEVIEPSSPSYRTESLTWAAQKDLKPRLVVRPTTLSSLSSILAHLSQTTLDFAVRSQGFGSSSAKDVLISMTAFDGFKFDRENEIVTLGAGQTWEEYYKKMEAIAPDYAGMASLPPPCGSESLLMGGCRLQLSRAGRPALELEDPSSAVDFRGFRPSTGSRLIRRTCSTRRLSK